MEDVLGTVGGPQRQQVMVGVDERAAPAHSDEPRVTDVAQDHRSSFPRSGSGQNRAAAGARGGRGGGGGVGFEARESATAPLTRLETGPARATRPARAMSMDQARRLARRYLRRPVRRT